MQLKMARACMGMRLVLLHVQAKQKYATLEGPIATKVLTIYTIVIDILLTQQWNNCSETLHGYRV